MKTPKTIIVMSVVIPLGIMGVIGGIIYNAINPIDVSIINIILITIVVILCIPIILIINYKPKNEERQSSESVKETKNE